MECGGGRGLVTASSLRSPAAHIGKITLNTHLPTWNTGNW